MSFRDDASRAVEVVAEYLSRRPLVRRRLEEQVNAGLRAQSMEQDRSTGIVREVRCDEHERPIFKCHEKHLPCEAGRPLTTDRTGEAGTSTDRARRLLMDLDVAELELVAATIALGGAAADNAVLLRSVHVWARPLGPVLHRSAATFDRALGEVLGRRRPQVDRSMDGAAGCGSCSRLKVRGVPLWSEPTYRKGEPTDLGGILKLKTRLCWSCYRWVLENDRLPTLAELRHKNDDPRGHWPKRHTQAKRAS